MRLLNEDRMVRKYIRADEPCPGDLLLSYYVRCKRNGVAIPEKLDNFVTSFIEQVCEAYDQGQKPNCNAILKLHLKKGRNPKSHSKKFNEVVKIGLAMETSMESGATYEEATEAIANDRCISPDSVKKSYGSYLEHYGKSKDDPLDHDPDDPAPPQV